MSSFDPERRREIVDGFPDSAAGYMNFLTDELEETAGSIWFKMLHIAPSDLSTEQLEVIADDLRQIGWNAEVAPREHEGDIRYGVLVQSEE
jgi:hypothetical protein